MTSWQTVMAGPEWPNPTLDELREGGQRRLRLVPMTQHALLSVSGADAKKFLQGQVTCDVNLLDQQQWRLGAHCNPKGRMISSFVLADTHDGETCVRLRLDLADAALAALKKYIVFSKATIEPATRLAVSISGPLHEADWPFPLPEPRSFSSTETCTVLRHDEQMVELWLTPEQLDQWWQHLSTIALPSDAAWWDWHAIQAGVAEVQKATTEAYLPQMFNYQAIDGISFKKGCYTGQEVVARMQYRGQLKKRLFHARATGGPAVAIGDDLICDDKSVGQVVAASRRNDIHDLLVVAGKDAFDNSDIQLASDGRKVECQRLPYAIP